MGPVRGTYKNPTDLQKYDGLTKIRHSDFGAVRANGPSETHANKSDPTREGRNLLYPSSLHSTRSSASLKG